MYCGGCESSARGKARKGLPDAMSNCAVGLEASGHVLFILAFAGFVAFDWYHRDNEDRPQPARDDWATVLARFVCRRPLGLAALVTAYAGYISLAAFVAVFVLVLGGPGLVLAGIYVLWFLWLRAATG